MTKQKEEKQKTCFVIMPISDVDGYEPGHFNRVYTHLIKPACVAAKFDVTRADEVTKTNYIIIDILRKLLDSDIVLCDLSGRNPNVLYELGICQAFNRPVVLIKDKKTEKIFDIQELRYTDYTESLRIDVAKLEIEKLSKAIQSTYELNHDDINSVIQLLSIKPASLHQPVDLSKETSVLYKAITDLGEKISSLEFPSHRTPDTTIKSSSRAGKVLLNDGYSLGIGDKIYLDSTEDPVGMLIGIGKDSLLMQRIKDNKLVPIPFGGTLFNSLKALPF